MMSADREMVERARKAADADQDFFPEVTHYTRRAFLHAYLETASKRRASGILGISEYTPHSPPWKRDEEFQKALAQVEEAAGDALEGELYRRAYEGVDKPVGFFKGEPTTWIKEYSDVLGIFLLKGLKPDKYRERVEMRGMLGEVDFTKLLDRLPHEAIDRVANGEPLMAVLASLARPALEKLGLDTRALPSGNGKDD